MKKSIITVSVLTLAIFSFLVSAAFAAEAVADYRQIITGMAEYAAASQKYDEIVANAKTTLDLQIKTAKSDSEKQNLMSSYAQYCKEQKNAVFDPLIGKMKYVLQQIAKEKGYTKVSAKGEGSGTDITEEAIARLNSVYLPKASADKKETAAVAQQPAKPEAQKADKAQPLPQPKTDTAQKNAEVQFGAGYDKGAIHAVVARAVQNGISTAYVAEAKDKRGRTLWRARATAESYEEARKLSAKLSHTGLRNFIVK